MKPTYHMNWKPRVPAGYGEPIPELQIVPVPTEPEYKVPDAVKILPIPSEGPLPGERSTPHRKRRLN